MHNAIGKLSRGSNVRDKIVKNFHSTTKALKRSGKHTESESELKEKLMTWVNQLHHENLYSDIPGRSYSNMCVSAEMLQEPSGTANTWVAYRLTSGISNITTGTKTNSVMIMLITGIHRHERDRYFGAIYCLEVSCQRTSLLFSIYVSSFIAFSGSVEKIGYRYVPYKN